MKQEGLKSEDELQSYFITRIEKFLNSKGREIIGWDEILEGGLAPNAAVMSWRGIEGGIKAARQKHPVVMTPSDYMYFDYYEGRPDEEPLAIGGYTPMEKVYNYEPVPEELNKEEQKYIIGVQANQWTEYIATPELAEYMTLPRLCALSEVAWSPKDKKNFNDFTRRMSTHYGRLDELNINYRRPKIMGFNKKNIFIESTLVKWTSQLKNTEIRYTTDRSVPTKNSTLYTKPFKISETTKFRIVEINASRRKSRIYEADYIKQEPFETQNPQNQKSGLSYKFFKLKKDIKSATELSNMKAYSNGTIERFVYPFKDENLPGMFGLIFTGYIKVPETGVYTFSVNSNDGSVLYLDDHLVVENDGPHSAFEKYGEVALKKGYHKIKLDYFQAGGGKALQVFIKVPGKKKVEITKDMLMN